MRTIVILIAIALPSFAQTCPEGFACTPIPQAVAPVAQQVAASVSKIDYLPKWYVSVGAGGMAPGHGGTFAYQSVSGLLGRNTYGTTAQEYTISAGHVQSCTLAGISLVAYQFGRLSIGMTGLGGGCGSTSGASAAAAEAQGFASVHLGKSPFSIVGTGRKTFTTDGRQAVKVTLGVSYGK